MGLEPVGKSTEAAARSTSKSAVSRKFVAMTEHALADLLAADLSELDLVEIMIDGVHFADHLCADSRHCRGDSDAEHAAARTTSRDRERHGLRFCASFSGGQLLFRSSACLS